MATIQGSNWFQENRLNKGSSIFIYRQTPYPYIEIPKSNLYHCSSTQNLLISFTAAMNYRDAVYITNRSELNLYGFEILGSSSVRVRVGNIAYTLPVPPGGINFAQGYNQNLWNVYINNLDEKIEQYFNGVLISDISLGAPVEVESLDNIRVGYSGFNLSPALGYFSNVHLAIFDSPVDILSYASYEKTTGVLHPNIHPNIIGHWPLQSVCKVDSSIFTPDVVEQYNYAKDTGALTANNGILINYTDDEVGLNNPADASVFYDFYEKKAPFSGTSKNIYDASIAYIPELDGQSLYLRLVFDIDASTVLTDRYIFDSGLIQIYQSGQTNVQFRFNNSSVYFTIPVSSLPLTNEIIIINDSVNNISRTYLNGILKTTGGSKTYTNLGNPVVLFNRIAGNRIANFVIHELDYRINNKRLIELNSFGRLSDEWENKAIHSIGNIKWNTSTGNQWINPSYYIDLKSLIPPRQKALYFDGVDQYLRILDFNPTIENGYTILIQWALESNRNFQSNYGDVFIVKELPPSASRRLILLGNANTKNMLLYSNPAGYIATGYNQYKLSDTSTPNFLAWQISKTEADRKFYDGWDLNGTMNTSQTPYGFDEISDRPLFIGREDPSVSSTRFLKGYISYLSIYKGLLSQNEIIKMCNNTLLANPDLKLQKNPDYSLELFIDFNNPYQIDSSLYFPDLSPNGHLVEAMGWTNLNDLENSLVSLCDLRSGETPITELDFWADELLNPIFDENDNYILT